VVREVHPEVCFSELAGMSMTHHKASTLGREERQRALALSFPQLHMIEKAGRDQGLPIEDILDATVACWSAIRLAGGKGRSCLTISPSIIPDCRWQSGFEVVAPYIQRRAFRCGPWASTAKSVWRDRSKVSLVLA